MAPQGTQFTIYLNKLPKYPKQNLLHNRGEMIKGGFNVVKVTRGGVYRVGGVSGTRNEKARTMAGTFSQTLQHL